MKLQTLALVLLVSAVGLCAQAQTYSIDWYKIAGGGGVSTNSQFSLSGTIGQVEASPAMAGGNYSITGGFWSIISVVQTSSAPVLSITYANNQVVVSWPLSVVGWTLQTNANLSTPMWGNYPGGLVVNNCVTNSTPIGNLYFRLKQ